MCLNNVSVDMKPPTCSQEDSLRVEEELFVSDEKACIAKILNSKYKLVDLKELTDNLPQINHNQKEQLHTFLKNETFFTIHTDYGKDPCKKSNLKTTPNHSTRICTAYHKILRANV